MLINPQLQLCRVLKREQSNEIGQPPIEFTIPIKSRQPKKEKYGDFDFIFEPNPLAQLSNILRGIEDPYNSQIYSQSRYITNLSEF
jgi:hypothetical protein